MRTRVVIAGRVQGVFFRDTIRSAAEREGLAGWVRNNADGTVEAAFEGDAGAVARLVALCRRGPPAARVDSVTEHEELEQGIAGFRVR
jgi:acylphosphatase